MKWMEVGWSGWRVDEVDMVYKKWMKGRWCE